MKLKDFLKPDPEFVKRGEAAYLQTYREKFGARMRATFRLRYFMRGAAAGVAFMVVLGSGAVYANERDVGPMNTLYPLKRTHEYVVLAFTDEAERPALYLELAERRFHELRTVKLAEPESSHVSRLTEDLAWSIMQSAPTLEDEDDVAESRIQPAVGVLGRHEDEDEVQDEVEEEQVEPEAEKEGKRMEFDTRHGITPGLGAAVQPPKAVAPLPQGVASSVARETRVASGTHAQASEDANLREKKRKSKSVEGIRGTREAKKKEGREKRGRGRHEAICESWREILESDIPEVREIVKENAKPLERFEKRCRR